MPLQRKRNRARRLAANEDVFHDYRWPINDAVSSSSANGPGGRPRFNWTPRLSRELIRLIIHTDIRFDDISAAMQDEKGNGPSESTCRDHWHEIFGYSPDVARLKNPEGCDRRFKEHMKAFKRYCALMEARNQYSTIRAERSADLDDSFEVAPEIETVVPSTRRRETERLSQARSLLHPVQHLRRTMASSHGPIPTTRRGGSASLSQGPDDKKLKTPRDVEQKYGFPQGFIPWIKGASISSTDSIRRISANTMQSVRRLSTRTRWDSVANVTSHPNYRQTSVLSKGSILCNYLSSLKPEDDVTVSEVESMISQGADVNQPNERGETPLHLAVALGSITIVAMLLENGADPKRETDSGVSISAHGRRASIAAIDPNSEDDYERRRMEIQRMICARIEFARTTVKYNQELITDQKPTKRLRCYGSSSSPPGAPTQADHSSLLRRTSQVPRVERPRLTSVPSGIQPGTCAEIVDDSATTDSDWQTRSSYGPYTPDTIGARRSTDTDRGELPRPSSGFFLTGHRSSLTAHDYNFPSPPYPVLEDYSISSNSIPYLTAHPMGSSDPVPQIFADPFHHAYNTSPNFGVTATTASSKVLHSHLVQNGMSSNLNVQPSYDMVPNIVLTQEVFHPTSSISGDRPRQLSMSVLHEAMDGNTASQIPSLSGPPGLGINNIEESLISITQAEYNDPTLSLNEIMLCPGFDPTNDQSHVKQEGMHSASRCSVN